MENLREQTNYLPNLALLFEATAETSSVGSVGARLVDVINQIDTDHQEELADTIGQAISRGHIIVKTDTGKIGLTSAGKEAAMDYLTVIHS